MTHAYELGLSRTAQRLQSHLRAEVGKAIADNDHVYSVVSLGLPYLIIMRIYRVP